jgi:hypothetical protein
VVYKSPNARQIPILYNRTPILSRTLSIKLQYHWQPPPSCSPSATPPTRRTPAGPTTSAPLCSPVTASKPRSIPETDDNDAQTAALPPTVMDIVASLCWPQADSDSSVDTNTYCLYESHFPRHVLQVRPQPPTNSPSSNMFINPNRPFSWLARLIPLSCERSSSVAVTFLTAKNQRSRPGSQDPRLL